MSGSVLTQNLPDPKTPVFDTETGIIDPIWYRFFLSMFARTGGSNPAGATGVPGGLDTNVQYNSAGTFGGLTNIQLTTRIQRFSSTLSGAVPASAGGTSNFLRADGTFNAPVGTTYANGTGLSLTGTTFALITPVAVANGGTGLASGTSGGILGYTAAGTLTSSGVLTNHAIVLGGGAGATPTVLGSLGTINRVLHGNAAGAPAFATVSLTADVGGILPVANGGSGSGTSTGSGSVVLATAPTLAGATVNGNGALALTSQTSGAGVATGTLTNAPHAGVPDFWVKMPINGVDGWMPWWHA